VRLLRGGGVSIKTSCSALVNDYAQLAAFPSPSIARMICDPCGRYARSEPEERGARQLRAARSDSIVLVSGQSFAQPDKMRCSGPAISARGCALPSECRIIRTSRVGSSAFASNGAVETRTRPAFPSGKRYPSTNTMSCISGLECPRATRRIYCGVQYECTTSAPVKAALLHGQSLHTGAQTDGPTP